MANVKIASIDPGISTGLIVSNIIERTTYITIQPKLICTLDNPENVMAELQANRCRLIVMEQRPNLPSKEGLENWEVIYQWIMAHKYRRANTLMYDHDNRNPTLFLIQPSQWKPFMKFRLKEVPKTDSKHSKDAACMLYYFIKMNHKMKEIEYG